MNGGGSTKSVSVSVGLATGLYGISFGALGTASGLDIWQTMALSLLMFSGASQFAFIGVFASGGLAALPGAIISSWLMGVRNGFYALRMGQILELPTRAKPIAAQLTIDESTAVALSRSSEAEQKQGFWWTGISVYIFWNLLTLAGALLGEALGDPQQWGLDAAAAAAFVGLVWPRLVNLVNRSVAAGALVIAILASPFVPAGVPVLISGLFGIIVSLFIKPKASR
jgi:predicted branched-subunit amino acid permease